MLFLIFWRKYYYWSIMIVLSITDRPRDPKAAVGMLRLAIGYQTMLSCPGARFCQWQDSVLDGIQCHVRHEYHCERNENQWKPRQNQWKSMKTDEINRNVWNYIVVIFIGFDDRSGSWPSSAAAKRSVSGAWNTLARLNTPTVSHETTRSIGDR